MPSPSEPSIPWPAGVDPSVLIKRSGPAPSVSAFGPIIEAPSRLTAEFRAELCNLLNCHSVDNMVNMPDYILTELVAAQIEALAEANKATRRWRGDDSD